MIFFGSGVESRLKHLILRRGPAVQQLHCDWTWFGETSAGSLRPLNIILSLRCREQKTQNPVKYWEIIADNLKKRGWSLGYVSAIDSEGRTIWIVDAHRDGKRYVVRADEKLTPFLELENVTRESLRFPNAE